MKPTRARSPLRLKATLFALSIAAMATQVGGASAAGAVAGLPSVAQASTAAIPIAGERELLAFLVKVLRGPPQSASWALLVAGLLGVGAIGHRRICALGSRSLDPYRVRRR